MDDENRESRDFLASLEPADGYDPLADLLADDDETEHEGRTEVVPTPLAPGSDPAYVVHEDLRPAEERIAELFDQMKAQRRVLLAIVRSCKEPLAHEQLERIVDGLQAHNRSIYRTDGFCTLLEKAGALRHVTEDGEPYSQANVEPRTVVDEDGVEYIQAADPLPDFWVSTDEGLAYAKADDPVARLHELLGQEAQFLPLYRKILELCIPGDDTGDRPAGKSTTDLQDAVRGDPLLKVSPTKHLFATYFTERLKDCEALAWDGSWVATELGMDWLASLDAE